MKKLYCLLVIIFLISAININSQNISFDVLPSEASNSISYRNIPKNDVEYRMANGATTFKISFSGDGWDLDSKEAFKYACQLMSEYLPTAYPIKIKAVRDSNEPIPYVSTIVRTVDNKDKLYCEVPIYITTYEPEYRIPTASIKRMAVNRPSFHFFEDDNLFFIDDEYDAIITFSYNDIFSCNLDGTTQADKYDMVTVSLRELARVYGMYINLKRTSANTITPFYGDYQDRYTPFGFRIFVNNHSESDFYNIAISNNVEVNRGYKLYAPSNFRLGKTLNYFDIDVNNEETILLQPDLPKGTAIRKIGKGLLEVLNWSGWTFSNEGVGIVNGSGKGEIQKDDQIRSSRNPFSIKGYSYSTRAFSSSNEISLIKENIKRYKAEEKLRARRSYSDSNFPYKHYYQDGINIDMMKDCYQRTDEMTMGWSFFLVTNDGRLERHDECLADKWDFETANINLSSINDWSNYSRTSDCYVKARLNWNFLDYSPHIDHITKITLYNHAKYIYIKTSPTKPTLEIKRNHLRTQLSNPNSYYKDIELSFGNIIGATRATMIQKEWDGGFAYTSEYDVDIKEGRVITSVDKYFETTLQLRVVNEMGVNYSDIITIYPEDSYSYSLSLGKTSSFLKVGFVDKNGIAANIKVNSSKIYSIVTATAVLTSGATDEVDIRHLPKGVYSITVTDENNKVYSNKFIK